MNQMESMLREWLPPGWTAQVEDMTLRVCRRRFWCPGCDGIWDALGMELHCPKCRLVSRPATVFRSLALDKAEWEAARDVVAFLRGKLEALLRGEAGATQVQSPVCRVMTDEEAAAFNEPLPTKA